VKNAGKIIFVLWLALLHVVSSTALLSIVSPTSPVHAEPTSSKVTSLAVADIVQPAAVSDHPVTNAQHLQWWEQHAGFNPAGCFRQAIILFSSKSLKLYYGFHGDFVYQFPSTDIIYPFHCFS